MRYDDLVPYLDPKGDNNSLMDQDFKGYVIKKVDQIAHWRIESPDGDDLPKKLQGTFTAPHYAKMMIDDYLRLVGDDNNKKGKK